MSRKHKTTTPAPRGDVPIIDKPPVTAPDFAMFETPEGRAVYVDSQWIVFCAEDADDPVAAPDESAATTTLHFAGGHSVRVKGDIESIMADLVGADPAPVDATFRSEAARISPPPPIE